MKATTTTLFTTLSCAFILFASSSYASTSETDFCDGARCQSDFSKLERMALFGSGEAATIVAVAYATGEGTEQDIKKARRHLKQAAVRWKEPMAMHQMSLWLRQGFIYEQDINKADELLTRAAEAKFGPALTDKAKLLLAQNTPEADKEAIALLEQADEQFYSPGRYLLAKLLASGTAVESDLARAGRLYKKLALVGYADSRQQLDKIITVLTDFTARASHNNENAELLAVVKPVLSELKQINDIETMTIRGQRFDAESELKHVVAQLDALKVYSHSNGNRNTGSSIPGNICGRGTARCFEAVDDTLGGLLNNTRVTPDFQRVIANSNR